MAEIEERVQLLEYRTTEIEKRAEKMDTSQSKIWERLDQHRDGQIRTQVLVEEVGKDVNGLQVQMAKLVETQQQFIATFTEKLSIAESNASTQNLSRWEKFYNKAFWAIVGISGTILLSHYVKF